MRGSEREFRPQCQSQCPPQNFHLVCSEGEYAAGCYEVRLLLRRGQCGPRPQARNGRLRGQARRWHRPARGGAVLRAAARRGPAEPQHRRFLPQGVPAAAGTHAARRGRGGQHPPRPKKVASAPTSHQALARRWARARGGAGVGGWLAGWRARASRQAQLFRDCPPVCGGGGAPARPPGAGWG